MNTFVRCIAGLLLILLVTVEYFLVHTYWSTIMDAPNFDKAGPIIQSLFTPLVAIVTVLFSYLVINTQFVRNQELEKIKQRLGEIYKRESDAYFKTWTAVSASYRYLAEMQKGTLDAAAKAKIEEVFSEAEPNLFVLEDADEGLFYSQWQAVKELVALSDKTADGADKIALWKTRSGPISDKLNEMRESFRKKYLDR